MSNTIYSRRYEKASDGHIPITKLIFTGTSSVSTTPDTNVYHWHLYTIINNTRSVLFDIVPGADLTTGVLMVVSKNTIGSISQSILPFEVIPTEGSDLTVQKLLDFIVEKRLDKYKYTSEGKGCRWWCTVVMEKLEEANLIDAGSNKQWLEWLEGLASERPKSIPMPVAKGIFY